MIFEESLKAVIIFGWMIKDICKIQHPQQNALVQSVLFLQKCSVFNFSLLTPVTMEYNCHVILYKSNLMLASADNN